MPPRIIIAVVCFAVYTGWSLYQRDWKSALLGGGLTAMVWPW